MDHLYSSESGDRFLVAQIFKCYTDMQNSRTTAGETASNYPKRARLFSPDGHARKDIVTYVGDRYTERFVRSHARRIGWPISVRSMEGGER